MSTKEQISEERFKELLLASTLSHKVPENLKVFPKYEPGDQIVYIPDYVVSTYAAISYTAKDFTVEKVIRSIKDETFLDYGFFLSPSGSEHAFCRFWNNDKSDLRTKSTSERCCIRNLFPYKSVPDSKVEEAIDEYVRNWRVPQES